MTTLPPTRGRRRHDTANEAHLSKGKSTASSVLPSWCPGLRKESLDSERAYDERVTTSTKTSEIRLRQESVRYWNRFLEEAEVAAFEKIVSPTCHQIREILSGDFGEDDGEGCDENQRRCDDAKMDGENLGTTDVSMELDAKERLGDGDIDTNDIGDHGDMKSDVDDGVDWEYCKQMFGLPSCSVSARASTPTSANQAEKIERTSTKLKSTAAELSLDQPPARLRYPFEALPVFVVTSPLISNCLQDRTKICQSMWRLLNGLESKTVSRQSFSLSKERGIILEKLSDRNVTERDQKTICLYLPRLLSSLTETLQVIWDGLLSHYENTHNAPFMDPDDPHYYSNPNDLNSKRHSYHVSKRKHYEALVDRKVTTESQKSKIGTKKQQSLQDFILEFLQFIYEEPEDFLTQELQDNTREQASSANTKAADGGRHSRKSPRRGNLILLLEDPRIIHSKVNTAAALGNTSISGGKPNTSNLVQSQLLETLAAWREIHGVPVSLVVFNSVGSKHEIQQNNVLLNPSFESSINGGRFGLQVSRCSIPSTEVNPSKMSIPASMAYGLWSRHFLQAMIDNPLPLLAPQRHHSEQNNHSTATEIVLRMYQDAFQNESSCCKWISSIRARLSSNFYAQKGSFVWDALNPRAALMMRSSPSTSERSIKNNRNIATDADGNNNNGIDRDRKPFEIGNDDVQVFQPEFVAWFCSYHKAHTLLSAQAGDRKADMILSEKCGALLECYRLLRKPNEFTDDIEKSSKRRKVANGEYRDVEKKSDGLLQFWWSISCSLLPLYVLFITVAEEDIFSSSIYDSTNRSAANGSSDRQNGYLLEGGSRWILGQLTEVCKQLSSRLGEREMTVVDRLGSEGKIESIESESCGIPKEHKNYSIPTKSSNKDLEDTHQLSNKNGMDRDYVEVTLKRYLQRGIKEDDTDETEGCDNFARSDGSIAMKEVQQQSVRNLKTMVQELIVLVAAFSNNQKHSRILNENKEDVMTRNEKIRSGIKEAILEMNLLALSEVEELTRQWIEFNPLMADTFFDEDRNKHSRYHDVSKLCRVEGRPVNFRRRILENLPTEPRQLYEAIEGRLSIDRDDWYNSFNGTIEDFVVGVCTLRKCGLIRPKRMTTAQKQGKARKRQEVVSYEKSAVVWC